MSKEHKFPLQDLDGLCYRMKCAAEVVDAIHDVMESGPNTADSYLDALFGACRAFDGLVDEMRDITDLLFEERRARKKEETPDA